MSWILLLMVIVSTTASADIFRDPSQPPLAQNAEPWPDQGTYDRSLYHETRHHNSGINNKNYRDTSLKYQKPQKGSIQQLWTHEKPMRRPIPFEYNDRSVINNVRDIPTFREHPFLGNFNDEIIDDLTKTHSSKIKIRATVGADDLLPVPETKPEGRNMFIPQVPKDCLVSGICENSPNYPHEYVKMLLERILGANITFNVDVLKTPVIAQNNVSEYQTKTLCDVSYQKTYPVIVRTTTGKWVYVINEKKNKVQSFTQAICENKEQPCQNVPSGPEGEDPICVQKFEEQSLWALDYNGRIVPVTTSVPSCCVCEIRVSTV